MKRLLAAGVMGLLLAGCTNWHTRYDQQHVVMCKVFRVARQQEKLLHEYAGQAHWEPPAPPIGCPK